MRQVKISKLLAEVGLDEKIITDFKFEDCCFNRQPFLLARAKYTLVYRA